MALFPQFVLLLNLLVRSLQGPFLGLASEMGPLYQEALPVVS
jgi:hypothetical protein